MSPPLRLFLLLVLDGRVGWVVSDFYELFYGDKNIHNMKLTVLSILSVQ